LAIDLAFRRRAVRTLVTGIGCYVLCDLDKVPIYVGQSTDGIRARVNRHLTSARSDIIANRQLDVWEIAWVLAFPVEDRGAIGPLENTLFQHFHAQSALMNGKVPKGPQAPGPPPEPAQIVQVMSDDEIKEKLDPALRLPRQAEHYSQIVGHFLAVKNSREIAFAIQAHFQRLQKYHKLLLGLAANIDEDASE
jgi:hypothetical protein